MSPTITPCELHIGRAHGAQDGKVVRIRAIGPDRVRLAYIEVELEDFARSVMGGELVQAKWIEGRQ